MRYFLLIILLFLLAGKSFSQEYDSISLIHNLSKKYFSKVDNKISLADAKLTKQTAKYLKKLQKEEDKIQRILRRLDPSAPAPITGINKEYNTFSQKIESKASIVAGMAGGQYNSYLDSLGTSLNFLQQFRSISDKAKEPLKDLQQLQSKLQQTEKIREFIAQRKEQIKQLLSKYTNLPAGLKNEYQKLSKTAYYYSAQVSEYKAMLKDEKKVEQKALSLLNKLPAFQRFFKENSQLASLFQIPGNSNPTQILPGLQTRSSIQSIIQGQINSGGPNAQALIQQNLSIAHAELDKLKDKVTKLGGGSSDLEMPNFKPNSQKTKSFLHRLELGSNVQFAKSNRLLPSTADIGLSAGYKLNDKSVIGIGASYKMGLGAIQHIRISHQGIGLRSFVDYQVKKQFFLTGGYELNYNAQFKNITELKNFNTWQQSGLIGVSKKYKISNKLKGNAQLLYDFLAYSHIPVSQPVFFRLGYIF